MPEKDIDKKLIHHLNDLYKDFDDVCSNENANLNQEKPFSVIEEGGVKTDDEDKSTSPHQYDFFGITGSK